MNSIYEILYHKITSLVPGIEKMKAGHIRKLKATGFPEIELHVVHKDKENLVMTLIYNYTNTQNDLANDRNRMTILVSLKNKIAEAISSQNKSDNKNQDVYLVGNVMDETLSYRLNARLNIWLNVIKSQGYNLVGGRKWRIW